MGIVPVVPCKPAAAAKKTAEKTPKMPKSSKKSLDIFTKKVYNITVWNWLRAAPAAPDRAYL